MAKKNNKIFYVNGRLIVDVNVPVTANTLEEAVQKSKDLKWDDFIEIVGEHNDSELKIKGVYEEYKSIEL